MNTRNNPINQDADWLDTVPASRIAGLLNSAILAQDIDEIAISRLRSSPRVGSAFKKILFSRMNKNTGSSDFSSSGSSPSQNPAIKILLNAPSSAEIIAKIIGAQIHASSLRQLITKAEVETMQQWLGRDIYRFALRQSANLPTNMIVNKPNQSLSQSIQTDGASILLSWVQRQTEADRSKIELLHGDVLTINPLNEELEDEIGTELSDSLVQEAVTAYKSLNI